MSKLAPVLLPFWKRRGKPHAQIHLPPLTAEEALLLSNLLDRAIAALWHAHGPAMQELLATARPSALPDEPCPSPDLSSDADLF